MADARETARAWMAERIGEKQWIRTSIDGMTSITAATAEDLADAILSADGVEAEQFVVLDPADRAARRKRVIVTLPDLPLDADDFDWVMEQVTGALPAQPIGETT